VISKAISDLEHTLGVRLFDRDRHGAELTSYGAALLKRGMTAFDEIRQGVKEVEHLRDPTVGELRIGASDPMAAALIPTILDDILRKFPYITFHVTGGASLLVQHLRSLRERKIDMIVGRLPPAIDRSDLDVNVLCQEPMLVAAGIAHPFSRRRRVRPQELVDEYWVLPAADSLVGEIVTGMFRAAGLELPRKAIYCSSIQMNNVLLATGRYLAVYPSTIVRLTAKQLAIKVVPTDLPVRSTPLGIITLKGRTLSPVARLFVEKASEVARG